MSFAAAQNSGPVWAAGIKRRALGKHRKNRCFVYLRPILGLFVLSADFERHHWHFWQ